MTSPAHYNALAILSYNRYPIAHEDLSGLNLPSAHFIGSLFYMCNFSDANITGGRIDGVLDKCKMHRCRMGDVEVGRRPSLTHLEKISSLSYTKDGRFLATVTETGILRIWDLNNYKCFFDFSHEEQGRQLLMSHFLAIATLC